MTILKIFRNAAGAIENIGAWDYMAVEVQRLDEAGDPVLDEAGVPIVDSVVTNPLPEGLVEGEAEIVEGPDGGLYEVGDARLTPAAHVISDDALVEALAARSGLTPEDAAHFLARMRPPLR